MWLVDFCTFGILLYLLFGQSSYMEIWGKFNKYKGNNDLDKKMWLSVILHILLYEILKLRNAVSRHWVICLTWYFHRCVRYWNYCVPWSFRSNVFPFVSSFPEEILEKPVLPTGKYFASLILRNQRLSTQFPQENWLYSPNIVQMVKVKGNRIVPGRGLHRRLVAGENCRKENCSRKTVTFAVGRSGEGGEYHRRYILLRNVDW